MYIFYKTLFFVNKEVKNKTVFPLQNQNLNFAQLSLGAAASDAFEENDARVDD